MRGGALFICGVVGGCGFAPTTSAPVVDDAQRDAVIDAPADAASDAFACSTAGLECPGATTMIVDKVTCNGGCWVKCQSDLPFLNQSDAAAKCRAWGGRLAPIRTAADEACVKSMLFPVQASWIGFEQASGQLDPADGWSWNSDGITPTYTNWDNGQPNDFDGTESDFEQCVFMTTQGFWQDVQCTNQQFFRFSCRHD